MIQKSVILPVPPAQAFALFTEKISQWWPESRRHTQDPASEIRLQASGRFWERAGSGQEVELGQVRVWEPPHRLVLDFYIGTDPLHPTEVQVTFTAEAAGTRVSIEHRFTAASQELWNLRAPAFGRSWDLVLAALGAAA